MDIYPNSESLGFSSLTVERDLVLPEQAILKTFRGVLVFFSREILPILL